MTVGPTPGVLARELPCTSVGCAGVGVELLAVIEALQAVISKNMTRVRSPQAIVRFRPFKYILVAILIKLFLLCEFLLLLICSVVANE